MIILSLICESGVEIGYEESTTYGRQRRDFLKANVVSPLFSIQAIFNS